LAVKIRLMRVGKKKQPTYRVVVADARSPRDGRFIEIIGRYEPRAEPSVVIIESDRALHWLKNGAQPTEQAAKLLQVAGVWDAFKSEMGKEAAVKPKPKTPKAKAAKAEPETPPAAKVVDDAPAAEAAPAEEAPADEVAAEDASA
jgi:small subunit ribosomal protein S16